MMDRRTLLVAAGASLVVPAGPARGAVSPLDYSWQLIARCRYVVVGTTQPPEGTYPGTGDARSIRVPVVDVRALKGKPPDPLFLDWPNIGPGLIDTRKPWELAGRPTVLFIGDDALAPPMVVLDGPSAIIPAEPAVVDWISKEIAAQAAYLAAWRPDTTVAHYGEVKVLIDWLMALPATDPDLVEKQAYAFAQIEALGEGAASALVEQLDDRRPLPAPRLTLGANRLGGAPRSHAPVLVLDALAAILEQLTGQQFGAPYDDGRESQRRLALDGWRLYAGRHTRGL